MDYKELIETLLDESNCDVLDYIGDAATAIETLLAERDAAVNMLRGECHACKHNAGWHNIGKCGACMHETARFPKKEERRADNWEWRGLTEKEREERLERSDTP